MKSSTLKGDYLKKIIFLLLMCSSFFSVSCMLQASIVQLESVNNESILPSENTPGNSNSPYNPVTDSPVITKPVKIISKLVLNNHNCILHDQGLECWGGNSYGELMAAPSYSYKPNIVADNVYDDIEVGNYHTCAIKNGGLDCWGYNNFGQLGDGTNQMSATPVSIFSENSGIQKISLNGYNSCAIKNGGLLCWGFNNSGQLGDNSKVNKSTPTVIFPESSGVTDISVGGTHACAIKNGGVYCWGSNGYRQIGDGTFTEKLIPTLVISEGSQVTTIKAGNYHTCAIVSAGLKCWGYNSSGMIGNGNTTSQSLPYTVFPSNSNVTKVSLGSFHTCALVDGKVYCWGDNSYVQLHVSSIVPVLSPVLSFTPTIAIKQLASSDYFSCAVFDDNKIKCWGSGNIGNDQHGDSDTYTYPVQVESLSNEVAKLPSICSLTDDDLAFSCVIVNGGVKCWGDNSRYNLGDGTTVNSSVPIATIPASSNVTALSLLTGTNGAYACAVVDGGVDCWGRTYHTPTTIIANGSQASSLQIIGYDSFSEYFGCAIVNGGLQCWGYGDYGQLGNGLGTNSATPVQAIAPSSGVTKFSALNATACAIVNGGLQCWGENTYGSVGNGTNSTALSPVNVFPAASGVTDIAGAGDRRTHYGATFCAVISGGLKCWGENSTGNVGDGTFVNKNAPVSVFAANSGVSKIVSNSRSFYAIKNGGLYSWGFNLIGGLGTGDKVNKN